MSELPYSEERFRVGKRPTDERRTPCFNSRMKTWLLGVAFAFAASAAFGQSNGEKEPEKRGSIPIGTSQDGSGPSHGTLIGGSIERAPDLDQASPRAVNRCMELSGALQEECIQDLGFSTTSIQQPFDVRPTPAATEIYADPRRRRR